MSCIIEWDGCKAYVNSCGMIEGVDGDMWALGRPLWVLKRRLNHNKTEFKISEGEFTLVESPRGRGRPKKNEVPKFSVKDKDGYYPGQYKVDPAKLEVDESGECVK